MIRELADDVRADLHTRKYPHPVIVGPERVARDSFAMAIVFERDRSAGDSIEAPRGANNINARAVFGRVVSGQFTVYARCHKQGAMQCEHEEECDRVCDGVLSALYRVAQRRHLPLRVVDSRLLTRSDLNADVGGGKDMSGERWADAAGCAARVRFSVETAVLDVDYTGASQPTGIVDDVAAPTVEASLAGVVEDEDP
jgi:hypothetical protein